MQYIKRFLSYVFFGSSENKGIDLKKFKKIEEAPFNMGAFGLMYKVQKDDEYYAAKVLKPLTIDQKSYVKEIENLLNIQHPAILPFEGYSLTDFSGESNPTILSKYSENGSLRYSLDLEQKAQALANWDNTHKYIILYGVAKGMKFLHEKGYIHCNLKPENIILNNNYFPQICDYGFSNLYDQDELISFANDNDKITYMAPEHLIQLNSPNSKKLWFEIELTKTKPDYRKIENYLGEMIFKRNTEALVIYAKFCLMKKEEEQNDQNKYMYEARKYITMAADYRNLEAKKMLRDLNKEEEEKRIKEDNEERKRNERKGDIEHFKEMREKNIFKDVVHIVIHLLIH